MQQPYQALQTSDGNAKLVDRAPDLGRLLLMMEPATHFVRWRTFDAEGALSVYATCHMSYAQAQVVASTKISEGAAGVSIVAV